LAWEYTDATRLGILFAVAATVADTQSLGTAERFRLSAEGAPIASRSAAAQNADQRETFTGHHPTLNGDAVWTNFALGLARLAFGRESSFIIALSGRTGLSCSAS
jgi:hypothetical protein